MNKFSDSIFNNAHKNCFSLQKINIKVLNKELRQYVKLKEKSMDKYNSLNSISTQDNKDQVEKLLHIISEDIKNFDIVIEGIEKMISILKKNDLEDDVDVTFVKAYDYSSKFDRETFEHWSDSSAYIFFSLREFFYEYLEAKEKNILFEPLNQLNSDHLLMLDSLISSINICSDKYLIDEDAERNKTLPYNEKLLEGQYRDVYHYGFPFGTENRFIKNIGTKELKDSVKLALSSIVSKSLIMSHEEKSSEKEIIGNFMVDVGFHMDSVFFRLEFGLQVCEELNLEIYGHPSLNDMLDLTEAKKAFRLKKRKQDWAGYKSPALTSTRDFKEEK